MTHCYQKMVMERTRKSFSQLSDADRQRETAMFILSVTNVARDLLKLVNYSYDVQSATPFASQLEQQIRKRYRETFGMELGPEKDK